MRKVVINLCISISVFIFVFINTTNEGSSSVLTLRGNRNFDKEVEEKYNLGYGVEISSSKSSSLHEQNQATQSVNDANGGIEKKELSLKRNLGGAAVADLFTTPIEQWSFAQWGVLFVLIWLISYFFRRCPCIWDMIACYCCFELLCDPNPDPLGFVAC